MVGAAPISIFVPDRAVELVADRFNHCSSICPYRDGTIFAWYSGSKECHDDQSVYLLYIDRDTISLPLRIGDKTGNPVVWAEDDAIYVLWSMFENHVNIRRSADRWKYCSNWVAALTVSNGRLTLSESVKLPGNHLLGRCNPIRHHDYTYLPMYDELIRCCVLMKGKGGDLHEVARFGQDVIQPTIWYDKYFQTLARTFHSTLTHAPFHLSYDGVEWSSKKTQIKNRNSSLHALLWQKHVMLLWNDTTGAQRINLTLGVVIGNQAYPLYRIADYGSYPSLCEDNDGNLCLSYSGNGVIKYYVCDKTKLLTAIGRDTAKRARKRRLADGRGDKRGEATTSLL